MGIEKGTQLFFAREKELRPLFTFRVVGPVTHAPDDGVGAVVVVPSPVAASDWAPVTIATEGADRGVGRYWGCE